MPQAGDPCHPLAAQGHAPAVAFAWQHGDDTPKDGGKSRASIVRAGDYAGAVGVRRVDAVMVRECGGDALTHHHGRNSGEDTLVGFNFKDGFGANASAGIVPTMTHGGEGGGTSRETASSPALGVRRLTPRECERLQGFADDYTAWGIDEQGQRVELSDSARYRMLGNAVNRRVSDWLDWRIDEVLL